MFDQQEKESKNLYPGLWIPLEHDDEGYSEGYRFCIDNLYGELYYFANEERGDEFIDTHDFYIVTLDEMVKLRRKHKIKVSPRN